MDACFLHRQDQGDLSNARGRSWRAAGRHWHLRARGGHQIQVFLPLSVVEGPQRVPRGTACGLVPSPGRPSVRSQGGHRRDLQAPGASGAPSQDTWRGGTQAGSQNLQAGTGLPSGLCQIPLSLGDPEDRTKGPFFVNWGPGVNREGGGKGNAVPLESVLEGTRWAGQWEPWKAKEQEPVGAEVRGREGWRAGTETGRPGGRRAQGGRELARAALGGPEPDEAARPWPDKAGERAAHGTEPQNAVLSST